MISLVDMIDQLIINMLCFGLPSACLQDGAREVSDDDN
jgi:hypothetical protein